MLASTAPETVGILIVLLGILGLGLAVVFLVLNHLGRKNPKD